MKSSPDEKLRFILKYENDILSEIYDFIKQSLVLRKVTPAKVSVIFLTHLRCFSYMYTCIIVIYFVLLYRIYS